MTLTIRAPLASPSVAPSMLVRLTGELVTSAIQLKVTHLGTSARWKSKAVDWTKFRDQTEEQFAKLKPTKNFKILTESLVNILVETVKKDSWSH